MATAINTNVGQREALLTPQATQFSTVQAAQTPVSTSGQELASALGVLVPAFGALAGGMQKERDLKDAENAAAQYNNLNDVDKALVIGHPGYAKESWSFKNKMRELQTANLNRLDNQTLETEIRAGKLNDPLAVSARMNELRAASLNGTKDMDMITQYDTESAKSRTKYEMIGSVLSGDRQLKEAKVQSQHLVNAAFQSGGYDAAMKVFKDSKAASNWSNSDSHGVILQAMESAVYADGASPMRSLELIQEMRGKKINDDKGAVIGTFGDISGHGDKLNAMESKVMTIGTKNATLEIEHLNLAATRLANTGDVAGTLALATHLTNNQNPAVAEWAKGKVSDFVLKAEAVNKQNIASNTADLLVAETAQTAQIVAMGDLQAVLDKDNAIGSTLMQPATRQVSVMGPGGKTIIKEITVSPDERLRNVKQLAIQQSDAEHKANPNESNADWFLRDYNNWSAHGMIPPHHAAMAKQGISSLRNVGDNTEKVSPDGIQTLRQFQLLQGNASAAKELFGPEYEYLYQIDQIERIDGRNTKDAVNTINRIDEKYTKIPEFKKSVDDVSASAFSASTSWLFGDTVKNGADLYGDVALLAKIAVSSGKSPEAALLYVKQRFDSMPVLHGSKVRPFVAQALVVASDTTPDELFQNYLTETIVDKGRVPKDLMSSSVMYPVEEKGKVVGFKFKMNLADKGYWFGIGKTAAPNGDVTDISGAPVYIPVDQLNKYGADASTSYGKMWTARRSTNRVVNPQRSNPFGYR